ncbi:sensor histidine kinase [Paractinoplanes brasiliensis]|uniref:histidine kinase n=1 Tax=Paractinoplanes brasiliensis TaxID=52695 RepID=A0A4R6JP80_9ACTN|nr:sensor histidine kinase [Actinoplanes brasiliensis]TDO37727.1 signal transduction histidine kinase [Actinoplanes brasiliensis]GID32066.1 two-component sensor histidine kinase [Actinoplanes brasiliensis]
MRELLRSVWREPRFPGAPVRLRRDWVLLGVIVVATLVEGILTRAYSGLALGLLLAPTVLWRRTHPLPVVAIAFVTCFVWLPQPENASLAYLLLLPYALFRWGSGRESVIGAGLILAKIVASAVIGEITAADMLLGFVAMTAAFALATTFRYRARLLDRRLTEAKLRERERLARDLHDTVAHHVSAMAIRAQAGLAVAQRRPEAAVDALRLIETEAKSALAEMRTMVRALRHAQDAGLEPSPGLTELPRLAGRSSSGPVVEVELAGDLDDVPATVGTAIYRLAQESVTNARRHARQATRIDVRVTADDGFVRLRVSDDGVGGHPAGSSGFGLVGMSERAGLLGGTCEAGPAPGRGWTVTAALPRTGAAA